MGQNAREHQVLKEIFTYARNVLVNSKTFAYGVCNSTNRGIDYVYNYTNTPYTHSELTSLAYQKLRKYSPDNSQVLLYWFPCTLEGKQQRLELFDKILHELTGST